MLLLYSEARLTPSVVSADRALRSTLQAHSPRPVHFYTEFLDLNLFEGRGTRPHLEAQRGHELVPAVRAAMRGERYVSPGGRH